MESKTGFDFLVKGSRKGIEIFDPRVTVCDVRPMTAFDYEYCYYVAPSRIEPEFISRWTQVLEKNAATKKPVFIDRFLSVFSKKATACRL